MSNMDSKPCSELEVCEAQLMAKCSCNEGRVSDNLLSIGQGLCGVCKGRGTIPTTQGRAILNFIREMTRDV